MSNNTDLMICSVHPVHRHHHHHHQELLAQLCPGHPALSGGATVAAAAAAGGGGGGGGGACSQGLREAYKQEVLSAQLLTGRPVNHVQIPVSMLAESPEQANMPQRIRLSSVCVASGRIVALRAGRITVAAVSKNGEIIQQVSRGKLVL